MYRPGGMSSDEESDWDQDYFSQVEVGNKASPEQIVADVSVEDKLMDAVMSRDYDSVVEALDKGADVNYSFKSGWNSLIQSCSLGCSDIVQVLLERGADVNCGHEKFTPLLAVCSSTCRNEQELLTCLDLLIRSGAKLTVSDWYGMSALCHAVKQGHEGIAVRLIEEGVDIDAQDQDGWSPIFFAVDSNKPDLVSLLMNSGANIYLIERRGSTLLDLALDKDNTSILELLAGGVESDRWITSDKDEYKGRDVLKRLNSVLPSSKDRLSGFHQEIFNILSAIKLSHLNKYFYEGRIGLGDFLTSDDTSLKRLGVEFWFERRKIIRAIERFHEYPWSISSFGSEMLKKDMDLFQIAVVFSTLSRQLYIISVTTYWWQRKGGVDATIKTLPDNLKDMIKTVRTIRGKLLKLQHCIDRIDQDSIVPSDLITPSSELPFRKFYKCIKPICFLLTTFIVTKKLIYR